jgi:hypothetical protein
MEIKKIYKTILLSNLSSSKRSPPSKNLRLTMSFYLNSVNKNLFSFLNSLNLLKWIIRSRIISKSRRNNKIPQSIDHKIAFLVKIWISTMMTTSHKFNKKFQTKKDKVKRV